MNEKEEGGVSNMLFHLGATGVLFSFSSSLSPGRGYDI